MRFFLGAACALLLGATQVLAAQSTDSVGAAFDGVLNANTISAISENADAPVELASCTLDDCCDSCDLGCCDSGCCGPGGCGGGIFGGVEYLQARADFSEALAYVGQTIPAPPSAVAVVRNYEQLDFDYNGSVRWFVGYRLDCCFDEVRFTSTRLSSDASASATVVNGTFLFQTPFNTFDGSTFNNGVTANGGAVATINGSVDLDYYDLTVAKSFGLGGPLSECCCCPCWDLTWSGGVRVADGGWNRSGFVNNAPAGVVTDVRAEEALEFSGVGLVMGAQGRRYLDKNGILSLHLKGSIAAMVGDVDYSRQQFTEVTGVPGPISADTFSNTRIIPVTELEVGGKVTLTDNLSFSAGYFLQAWHDLGMSPETQVNGLGAQDDLRFDDANILGFDGYYLRLTAGF